MFKDVCDGYIAPKIKSPYHINNEAHEEIVIFDPIDKLKLIDDIILNPKPISINIYKLDRSVIITPKLNIFISKTGGNKHCKYIDKNKILNNKKLYKEANIYAKKYVKSLKVSLYSPIPDSKPHKSYFKEL
jgi:hypothetical protein